MMNAIIQFYQTIFTPLVILFTISNLAMMGLQVNIPQVGRKMKNVKFVAMILVWGWVVGPLLGWLIIKILPLDVPYANVVLLTSLAPCAPFLPPMITKARGDIDFGGAFIPLAAVGTVIFMPLLAPLLIKGIALSSLTLAKPLVITVLIPLIIGALIRTYATRVADKIFKPVKLIANLSTLLTIVGCFVIYTPQMIDTAGSFALLSMTVFMLVLGLLAYRFGFGLKQNERSIMSMGMGTRNIAAVLAGVLAIPNGDPRMTAMVIMWTLWSFILVLIFAPVFGKLSRKSGVPV
ncbi:MAG TPA: hypothetical protein PKI34_12350 [Bacteroidales bacterium]|nr:hypothetical protein [Bacteroidales bacterium]